MSRKRHTRREEAESEIDLTPMLDVVFIMLIFFIVTASFVKEWGIGVNTPPDVENEDDSTSKNIVVTINASNEIWMEERRIDVRAVRANIARLHAENPKASVAVRAHEESEARLYVAVADASREAKVYNVALVPYND